MSEQEITKEFQERVYNLTDELLESIRQTINNKLFSEKLSVQGYVFHNIATSNLAAMIHVSKRLGVSAEQLEKLISCHVREAFRVADTLKMIEYKDADMDTVN